jgi:hypothetical protein
MSESVTPLEPRGVHAQHDFNAMSVLLRDPKKILAQHELPGHGGMPRMVRAAPSNIERLDALAPAKQGKNILIGGVTIPSQLQGRRLLEGISLQERLQLKLVESKISKSGCVALRYLKQ